MAAPAAQSWVAGAMSPSSSCSSVLPYQLFIPIGILIYWTIDGLTDSSTASEVWSYSDHSIYTYAWNSLWTAGLAATSRLYRPAARAPGRTFQQSFSHAGLRGFRKPVMPSGVVVALSLVFLLNRYGTGSRFDAGDRDGLRSALLPPGSSIDCLVACPGCARSRRSGKVLGRRLERPSPR